MTDMKVEKQSPAEAGVSATLPQIESFANQYEDYLITVDIPEFTSLCPKTSQPDFGRIIIEYVPDKRVIELKSLKLYIQSYRDLGIFYENAVNRILADIVRDVEPARAKVRGEFKPRGGIISTVEAEYPRDKKR